MNAVVKTPHPSGRPRIYDRDALASEFERYIEATEIPIVAEFASQRGVPRFLLYDWPEFSTLLKNCTDKKEAALERKALAGEINVVMAIFSLKQMGWTDRTEQTHKDGRISQERVVADLERLGHNLEALLVRKKDQLQGKH